MTRGSHHLDCCCHRDSGYLDGGHSCDWGCNLLCAFDSCKHQLHSIPCKRKIFGVPQELLHKLASTLKTVLENGATVVSIGWDVEEIGRKPDFYAPGWFVWCGAKKVANDRAEMLFM